MPTADPHCLQTGLELTVDDVMSDLDHGRGPGTPEPVRLGSLARPTLGGTRFRRRYLAAKLLGALHARLARRALLELWFTPWIHPSALRPVEDAPAGLSSWSLDVPASTRAAHDGLTLRGYVAGDGPTVVMVHGWSGRAADWRHAAANLVTAGWRVVVPDLPAHGMTPGDRTNLFELGRALAAVLDKEHPRAVVTHSMGFPATMVALEAGAPRPDAIVAVSPGRKIARAVAGFAARLGLPPRLERELRRGIEADFGADVWDVLDVDRVLGALDVPGLVIHDVDDDEVPLTDAQAIAASWRGAEIVETSGLGHRKILRDADVRRRIVEALAASRATS